jgi:hypothetical protein
MTLAPGSIGGLFLHRSFRGDETDARLWKIAENLRRSELTVTEPAEHIAEWVEHELSLGVPMDDGGVGGCWQVRRRSSA